MLTKFIERPEIRQSFKDNAVRVKLPLEFADMEALVIPTADNRSLIGTSFDYMARFRLARSISMELGDLDIDIWDTGWVAEKSLEAMRSDPRYSNWVSRWEGIVSAARTLFDEFVAGREHSLVRVARCAQCLGSLDLLAKIDMFNPNFKPFDDVTKELLELDAVFDPLSIMRPQRLCLLNPMLPGADSVGGGDVDIVVDRTLFNIKTAAQMSSGMPLLRQISAYAAILRRDGTLMEGDDPVRVPIDRVGIYFARYGRAVTWSLDELFPNGGFDRFADTLMEGLKGEGHIPSP